MIPIAKPTLGDQEAEAVRRILLSGWVSQGPEVAAFEQEFAAYVGAAHACAVSSCTTALHLSLLAVGVEPGDEVITVSHSFIATANAVRHAGAVPKFVDIEPGTFNMDPQLVAEAIGARTRAILCVHQMGMPCDLPALLRITRDHDLPLVEDAACAIGSEVRVDGRWQRIGRPHGTLACFSFHPRKVLTTGDGGMITTSDPELDEKVRRLRHHWMSVPDTVRHRANSVIFESYPHLGFNYRLTDIQAAVGRVQLERLPEMIQIRRNRAARYSELLAGIRGVSLPAEPEWARSNWQTYCVRLPDGVDQHAVMQRMLDDGVSTRRGIMCAHREGAFQEEPWLCAGNRETCDCGVMTCQRLTESERAQDTSIALPLFHDMTDDDQERVVAALRRACEAQPE